MDFQETIGARANTPAGGDPKQKHNQSFKNSK
jgi:hypothetical protein